MASIKFTVDLTGEKQLLKALNKFIKAGGELEPALHEIGDLLIGSTQARRTLEQAPDGTPWEPLSPITIERKGHSRILENTGILFDNLAKQITGNELHFGATLKDYANMQQEGGITSPNSMIPNKTIPARPFIGLSESDEISIVSILKSHLLD
ncbi:phage virion morphogenesis protein [uncultured Paraglaciecola sp.]|uniref:phage virion morphogenesis protein n=1 Tax=uncultured Paraglaciecola sp. TaxID=1765024 RepID=UPI002616BD85|nr:phage virion morphogenesis protein [uncultured Paraglaciecola sp.]